MTAFGNQGGLEELRRKSNMAATNRVKLLTLLSKQQIIQQFKCVLKGTALARTERLRSISTSLRVENYEETSSYEDTKLLRVALIGEPNCGKSTLTNSIVGNQVSVVTHVPHTTRQRTTGVYTEGI